MRIVQGLVLLSLWRLVAACDDPDGDDGAFPAWSPMDAAGPQASGDASAPPRLDPTPWDGGTDDAGHAILTCDVSAEQTLPVIPGHGSCATGDGSRSECSGRYCDFSACQLLHASSPGGCDTPTDLALTCDGSLAKLASDCGRLGALAPQGNELARECIEMEGGALGASADCRGCYADFVVCARAECSGECFAGDGPQCDLCNDMKGCFASFYACSGLPARGR